MKKLKFVVTFIMFAFIFCAEDKNNNPVRLADGQSGVDVEVKLGDGPLPSKLIMELSASGQETRYDTVDIIRTPVYWRFLNIAPYKEWKINAHTVDMNDSAIHTGSITFTPQPNRMSYVLMELQSRYFSMHALFSRTNGNMTRAEILIDDNNEYSPSSTIGNRSDTVIVDIIDADYVPLKSQYKITGRVYGMYNGSEELLFSGDTIVTLPWYNDQKAVFTLSCRVANNNQEWPYSMTVWLQPFSGNTKAGRIGQPVYFNETRHYYDVVTLDRDITWEQAKEMAAALSYKGMRGHLATITSARENEFIWQYLAKQSGVSALFIGGHQDPPVAISDTANWDKNWKWITGELWNYTNWAPGEPNKFEGRNGRNEIWLMMWVHSGRWNDQASSLRGFIVEYE